MAHMVEMVECLDHDMFFLLGRIPAGIHSVYFPPLNKLSVVSSIFIKGQGRVYVPNVRVP